MFQNPNYTFNSSLGQGGMATVWLAEHKTLNKPVAIKVLNKEFVNNENIRKRFLAEARNLFEMSHNNIIKVTDLIDQDDLVAFVMEYIEGQTLKEYLEQKGKLPDIEIRSLFSQMLDAVGYVHEHGLIHRDIKPSNFIISTKGVVKLLDFGIAKNTDQSSAEYTMTGTTQNMGTPMYMSPEQVKSTKDVTIQSDIYSLGVVLWQMVMGVKPYFTSTLSTFELQTKIVTELLPPTGTYWDLIIQESTAKNATNRFKDITIFKYSISTIKTKSQNSATSKTDKIKNRAPEATVVFTPKKEKIIKPEKKIQAESESTKIEAIYATQVEDSHKQKPKVLESTGKVIPRKNISKKTLGKNIIKQNYIFPQILAYLGIFSLVLLFADEMKYGLYAIDSSSQSFVRVLEFVTIIPYEVISVLYLVVTVLVLISLRKYCQNFGPSSITIPFTALILYEIFLVANYQFRMITFMYMYGYYILDAIESVLCIIIGVILVRIKVKERNFLFSGIALFSYSVFSLVRIFYDSQNDLETRQISDDILLSFFLTSTLIFYLYFVKNIFKNANQNIHKENRNK